MTLLPAPDPRLRAVVVVLALAGQSGLDPAAFEVILVLDGCTDATEAVARRVGGEVPRLVLHVRPGPGRGVGAARKLGMDLACQRLLSVGRPDGVVASTDADSAVAADWLRVQVDAVAAGARAIGGRIELFEDDAAALAPGVRARRGARAAIRAARLEDAAHWQFSGASMALAAATYDEIGGLDPVAALEDEALERSLRRHGVRIERRLDVRVATSGRLRGRAVRGLARDLTLDDWSARRTYQDPATLDDLLAVKGQAISLVLPTRDVAATLGPLLDALEPARARRLVDEVLVVDAASTDATVAVAAERGVTAVQESDVLAEFGPALGKGDALWRGLSRTSGEIVVFLDTDTTNFSARFLLDLVAPLLRESAVHLVKGAFRRPFERTPDEGGRVTELLARPLLNLHLPDLAGFVQPLAGEVAARRELLEALAFPVGYGVEIAMLIDAYRRVGLDGLAQAELGVRENRHQPLRELGGMAYQVLVAASRRIHGSDAVDALGPGVLLQPTGGALVPRPLAIEERPPLRTIMPEPLRR
jgi:glycosyltransferase involved in cell wall biosynthesis